MSQKWYINQISNYDLDGIGSTIMTGISKDFLEAEAERMNNSSSIDSMYYYIVSDKPMEDGEYLG